MSTAQVQPEAYEHFFKTALEYYVSGRGAARCWNVRVDGHLLHHAVEMLLKGQLSKSIPLKDLRKEFGHDLATLWIAVKRLFSSADLTEFDAMIDELERFEEIRYPDAILANGVTSIGIGFCRGKPINRITPGPSETVYQMGVGDVDALFARLFPLCRLNPQAYFDSLSMEGRSVLTEWNAESQNWLGPLP